MEATMKMSRLVFASPFAWYNFLFFNGNACLVGNPVNKLGYSGEANWVSQGAATYWAKADDAKIDETGSIRDGQRAATVTLEITGSRSVPFDQNVGRD